MSRIYLIDNNIWAAHEMGYPDAVDFINKLINQEEIMAINTVIQMELMSHFEIETNHAIKKNRELYINQMADENFNIDSIISLKAGEIRRKAKLAGRKVPKGPDALIAATAAVRNCILVSNNDKDFIWVSTHPDFGFNYINPINDNTHYNKFQDAYLKKED